MGRAESELHHSQDWIQRGEGLKNRDAIADSFHQLANRWVAFHGYAFQNRKQEMARVLSQIDSELHHAHALSCAERSGRRAPASSSRRDPYLGPNQ